ncbi:MAG: oligosaccharide flippase family protein [Muribaculaceae bacterium]|nr:oligosaccharide flippase family protein [Muribaculaceae bacterium]
MGQSDIATRMAGGAFWSVCGTSLARLFTLVAGIVCSLILGKEVYGQYGMVKSTVMTFMNVGGYFLSVTATKYIAEYRREHDARRMSSVYYVTNGFAVVVGAVMALVLLLCAGPLADLLKSPEMASMLRLSSFIVLLVVVNIAQEGVITGFEDFFGRAVVQVVGCAVQAVAMIAGCWLWGLMGGIVGFGVGFLCIALMNKVRINRDLRAEHVVLNWRDVHNEDFKILVSFSLPSLLMAIFFVPVFFVLRIWLKRFGDFADVADFEVSYQWFMLILFIPNAVGTMILPILTSLNNDGSHFRRVQKYSLLINGSVAAVVALLLAILSPWIFQLYGKGYTNPMPLVVLSVTSVFAALTTVLGYSITSKGRMWQLLLFNLIWAAIILCVSHYSLLRGHGATGVAVAMLLAYIMQMIVQGIYLHAIRNK